MAGGTGLADCGGCERAGGVAEGGAGVAEGWEVWGAGPGAADMGGWDNIERRACSRASSSSLSFLRSCSIFCLSFSFLSIAFLLISCCSLSVLSLSAFSFAACLKDAKVEDVSTPDLAF